MVESGALTNEQRELAAGWLIGQAGATRPGAWPTDRFFRLSCTPEPEDRSDRSYYAMVLGVAKGCREASVEVGGSAPMPSGQITILLRIAGLRAALDDWRESTFFRQRSKDWGWAWEDWRFVAEDLPLICEAALSRFEDVTEESDRLQISCRDRLAFLVENLAPPRDGDDRVEFVGKRANKWCLLVESLVPLSWVAPPTALGERLLDLLDPLERSRWPRWSLLLVVARASTRTPIRQAVLTVADSFADEVSAHSLGVVSRLAVLGFQSNNYRECLSDILRNDFLHEPDTESGRACLQIWRRVVGCALTADQNFLKVWNASLDRSDDWLPKLKELVSTKTPERLSCDPAYYAALRLVSKYQRGFANEGDNAPVPKWVDTLCAYLWVRRAYAFRHTGEVTGTGRPIRRIPYRQLSDLAQPVPGNLAEGAMTADEPLLRALARSISLWFADDGGLANALRQQKAKLDQWQYNASHTREIVARRAQNLAGYALAINLIRKRRQIGGIIELTDAALRLVRSDGLYRANEVMRRDLATIRYLATDPAQDDERALAGLSALAARYISTAYRGANRQPGPEEGDGGDMLVGDVESLLLVDECGQRYDGPRIELGIGIQWAAFSFVEDVGRRGDWAAKCGDELFAHLRSVLADAPVRVPAVRKAQGLGVALVRTSDYYGKSASPEERRFADVIEFVENFALVDPLVTPPANIAGARWGYGTMITRQAFRDWQQLCDGAVAIANEGAKTPRSRVVELFELVQDNFAKGWFYCGANLKELASKVKAVPRGMSSLEYPLRLQWLAALVKGDKEGEAEWGGLWQDAVAARAMPFDDTVPGAPMFKRFLSSAAAKSEWINSFLARVLNCGACVRPELVPEAADSDLAERNLARFAASRLWIPKERLALRQWLDACSIRLGRKASLVFMRELPKGVLLAWHSMLPQQAKAAIRRDFFYDPDWLAEIEELCARLVAPGHSSIAKEQARSAPGRIAELQTAVMHSVKYSALVKDPDSLLVNAINSVHDRVQVICEALAIGLEASGAAMPSIGELAAAVSTNVRVLLAQLASVHRMPSGSLVVHCNPPTTQAAYAAGVEVEFVWLALENLILNSAAAGATRISIEMATAAAAGAGSAPSLQVSYSDNGPGIPISGQRALAMAGWVLPALAAAVTAVAVTEPWRQSVGELSAGRGATVVALAVGRGERGRGQVLVNRNLGLSAGANSGVTLNLTFATEGLRWTGIRSTR